jgi:hypothetical protein
LQLLKNARRLVASSTVYDCVEGRVNFIARRNGSSKSEFEVAAQLCQEGLDGRAIVKEFWA